MHHWHSPHTVWEFVILIVDAIVVVWVFYLAIKYTVKPGEENPDHIKRKALELEDTDRNPDSAAASNRSPGSGAGAGYHATNQRP
jgi:hypothetical protein